MNPDRLLSCLTYYMREIITILGFVFDLLLLHINKKDSNHLMSFWSFKKNRLIFRICHTI